ncbi:terminase family protein [Burkholderia vietnamiensis]|uniref:terminase family protein n=1 Tax=Burkholderia vietnamiensis TaxID=60552 RepID=UPI0015947A0E|nr:terminase family protein [Burkholderia vietnamiensis]
MDAQSSVAVNQAGRIIWRPQPGPQTLLLSCPVEDVLFGGARGGGKSDALLGDWAAHAGRSNGHASGLIVRRTTPQLEEIIQRSKAIYPGLGASWLAGIRTWIMPCGSRLKMRFLERDEDADNYQGHQYTWIGVDESGTWSNPDPIDKLRATLRSPYGVPCVMRSTANPGGPGHQWLKERYVMPAPPMTPFFDKERNCWRVFIPSRVTDNQKLLEADPNYVERLKSSGPPWLVKAWLDGDWDASAGDSFFPEYSLLVDGVPPEYPERCDQVFAVVDTALKDSLQHDGTAVTYYAKNKITGTPLTILDWDVLQIEGALLDAWLPSVAVRLEQLAATVQAREGSVGMWIEDKASGIVLLQQAARRGLPAYPIDGKLVAMGKEGRALNVSGHVFGGKVKISRYAYEKVVTYKAQTRNHFLSQICGFRLGTKTPHHQDLLDTFCYGIAISLGDSDGY